MEYHAAHTPVQSIHYVPPAGWMNDPNGPILHMGVWHLFFQHEEKKHWGHAVSRDLKTWETLPIAISPCALGEIWSGSIVCDLNNTSGLFAQASGGLVAIFTLRTKSAQAQGIAFSEDCGLTWTFYKDNPVLSDPSTPDFRDPKVFWHQPSMTWVMVLAVGGEIRFYASTDLKCWIFLSRFGAELFPAGAIFECPDLFEVVVETHPQETRWVLNVSVVLPEDVAHGTRRNSMYHMTGNFDGRMFANDGPPRLTSFGPDDYAAITFAGTGDRRLWIGWMSNWIYANGVVLGSARGGCMTLPRELTLAKQHDAYHLIQRPPREVLFVSRWIAEHVDTAIVEGCHQILDLYNQPTHLFIKIRPSIKNRVGVRIGSDNICQIEIGFDAETGHVIVVRGCGGGGHSLKDFAGSWTTPVALREETIDFNIFIDRASVEVFVNDGEAYCALLQLPIQERHPVYLFAKEEGARLMRFDRCEPIKAE